MELIAREITFYANIIELPRKNEDNQAKEKSTNTLMCQ